MLHRIQIPHAVLNALQLNDILIDIKRKILLRRQVNLSIRILEDQLRILAHGLHIPLEFDQLLLFHIIAAVEHDQLRIAKLLEQKGPHRQIGKIGSEGGRINTGNLLLQNPRVRQTEIPEIPHTVPFNKDTARLVLGIQRHKRRRCELLHRIDDCNIRLRLLKELLSIFYFSLLAEDQQCTVLGLKIRLADRVAVEGGLAGVQKAIDHIYRYLFHCVRIPRSVSANLSAFERLLAHNRHPGKRAALLRIYCIIFS